MITIVYLISPKHIISGMSNEAVKKVLMESIIPHIDERYKFYVENRKSYLVVSLVVYISPSSANKI